MMLRRRMARSCFRTFLLAAVAVVTVWGVKRSVVTAFPLVGRQQQPFCHGTMSSQRIQTTTTITRTTRNNQRGNNNLPSSFPLFMISKKEKQRRQEEKIRLDALHKEEILQRKRTIVNELKELKRTQSVIPARKLLKSIYHEGLLNDIIGKEGRRIAIELFYGTNRPSDVIMILSTIPQTTTTTTTTSTTTTKSSNNIDESSLEDDAADDEQRELQQYGLWGHSMLKEWESAAKYAYSIYSTTNQQQKQEEAEEEEDEEEVQSEEKNKNKEPFASHNEQEQLRKFAIQAFTNVDENLDIARKLLKPDVDGPSIINMLLKSYLRKEQFQEARTLWKERSSSLKMDQESYRLILQCGAKLGDISLMESVLEYLGTKTSSSDLFLVLNSLVGTKEVSIVPPSSSSSTQQQVQHQHQALVVSTFQAIIEDDNNDNDTTSQKKGKDIRRQVLAPEMLSKIFLTVKEPHYFETLFRICQNYYDNNNNNKVKDSMTSWMKSLQPAAKVQLLPFLVFTNSPLSDENDPAKDNAWELLKSSMTNQKTMMLPTAGQNREFYAAALELARNRWDYLSDVDGFHLASFILTEHWLSLIKEPEDDTLIYYDHLKTITVVLGFFSSIRSTQNTNTMEDAEKILMFEILASELASQFPPEEQQGEELEIKMTFSNARLDSIVGSYRQLLRAISTTSSLDEYDKKLLLVSEASKTAMDLISYLYEFSLEACVSNNFVKSDNNQSKEAIQTIMKCLLEADLFPHDEFCTLASHYYFSLVRVAQSWPNEGDYRDLIYPIQLQQMFLNKDPFSTFRSCVLGEKIEKKTGGFLRTVSSWLEKDDGDLAVLLPTCMDMNRDYDARMGTSFYPVFVEAYKNRIINEFDLFIDRNVLGQFCEALEYGIQLNTLAPEVTRVPAFSIPALWNIELAKAVINELATCNRARFWIGNTNAEDINQATLTFSANYLYNMYMCTGTFWKLLDENGTPLDQEYRDACRSNCLYIMDCLGNKGTTRSDKKIQGRRGFRERPLGSETDTSHWAFVTAKLLVCISECVVSDDAIGTDAMNEEGEFASSSYYLLSRLVEDVMSQLPYRAKHGVCKMSAEGLRLHPHIHTMIRDWNEKQETRDA